MTTPPANQTPRRRIPTGALVLGASVLASFVWWLMMPRTAPPATVDPEPPAATAPGPADAPAEEPAPAAREARPTRPAPAPARTETSPPPVEAPRSEPRLLRVTGDVAGADVFVDRAFVGKAPFETRTISAGPHQINVSAPGFDGVSQRVEVAEAGTTEMTFSLKAVRLDATVDVVHRHALGSCEGQLSAAPAGLRYTPSEGRDGFVTALSALEEFEVDYQEKRLRVKIKGGRTFNFTTRAGNADPLLVFHRDVEKARTKLAGGG
jgi:hypothetical protein